MVTPIRKLFNQNFSREYMQVALLKNIVSSIAGQQATGIVDLLHDKKNVNEFLIAKKLKLTINQTRNILYKLADEGIVSFIRKKDKKKGGWYTYFWTLNVGKGLIKFREHLAKKLESLTEKLNLKKTERFYYCPSCNSESNEEVALLYQYTCPECGEVLQLKEKGKEIEQLEKEIAKINEILASLEQEIGIVTRKEQVVKVRKIKAEAKKKSKERAAKKRARELEFKKLKAKKNRKKNKNRKNRNKKKRKKRLSKFGRNLRKLFR
jgi:transcription initiation factor TFIIE subunit alpha